MPSQMPVTVGRENWWKLAKAVLLKTLAKTDIYPYGIKVADDWPMHKTVLLSVCALLIATSLLPKIKKYALRERKQYSNSVQHWLVNYVRMNLCFIAVALG